MSGPELVGAGLLWRERPQRGLLMPERAAVGAGLLSKQTPAGMGLLWHERAKAGAGLLRREWGQGS